MMRLFRLMAIVAIGGWSGAFAGINFELQSVSSRPDAVSGGDTLVELHGPKGPQWVAQLNGRDVTQSFRLVERSKALRALLTGLQPRRNVLEIRVKGKLRSRLELLNYPLQGPIFSGPHQQPFICQTAASGLGPAVNADCDAKTVVSYYYKSTESPAAPRAEPFAAAGNLSAGFKPYPTEGPRPSDVAQTTLADGRTVNYIVRRELGTINRAIYEIEFLHEPGQPLPTPWTGPTASWNGRLVYSFGAGCCPGHRQGVLSGPTGEMQDALLTRGYALATSTLNNFGVTYNDKISAETLSMVKEYFIERYGVPVHTIGMGGSGGAMQAQLIVQNYPGLLDGIIVAASFPDFITYMQPISDCTLLERGFNTSTQPWTEDQKTVVSGFATWHTCSVMVPAEKIYIDPRGCDRSIPEESIYDARTNPKGIRCDLYSNEINVLGRDPRTGLARRPLDNVGVQYGLVAFNSGKISAEQFVELNERVGGYDYDGNLIESRTEADVEAVRLAYERGLVLTGGGDLSRIPIIDWRNNSDIQGDNHVAVRSFITRARLISANGQAQNQVMLMYPPINYGGISQRLFKARDLEMVQHMDRWLDGIAADVGDLSTKLARNKPAKLTEGCWQVDGKTISERLSYGGSGRCNEIYPSHADPRIAAGAPLANDILKCALKPIDPAQYAQKLTPDQLNRLNAVFSSGVCDYATSGVGQQITRATWQTFHTQQSSANVRQ